MVKGFYEFLELTSEIVSESQIKKNYRKSAQKWHTDKIEGIINGLKKKIEDDLRQEWKNSGRKTREKNTVTGEISDKEEFKKELEQKILKKKIDKERNKLTIEHNKKIKAINVANDVLSDSTQRFVYDHANECENLEDCLNWNLTNPIRYFDHDSKVYCSEKCLKERLEKVGAVFNFCVGCGNVAKRTAAAKLEKWKKIKSNGNVYCPTCWKKRNSLVQIINETITEIEDSLLREPEIKLTDLEIVNQNFKEELLKAKNEEEIFDIRNRVLNNISKKRGYEGKLDQAIREIIDLIREKTPKSFSASGFNNETELKNHFNKLPREKIDEEKERIIDLINNYSEEKSNEIDQAIGEILQYLEEKELGKQGKEILGENWENYFWGLNKIEAITRRKSELIAKIDTFLANNSKHSSSFIEEIIAFLNKNGLSENILGPNWKIKFKNKNLDESTNLTLNFLKKIEEQIDQNGKEELNNQIRNDCKEYINKKSDQSHSKLKISVTEIDPQLFFPYNNLNEKLESLESVQAVIDFQNDLQEEIKKKQEEKLTVIANRTIAEIDKLLSQAGDENCELEQFGNFRKVISSSKDPDFIEEKKTEITNWIQAQREKSNDFKEVPDDNNKLLKYAVIGTAISSVIAFLVLIIYRVNDSQKRKRK